MKKSTLALMCCLVAPLAQAQMLQPGLWELTSSNMQVDGQAMPDLQMILGQLKNLPPEQRAMVERNLENQGVTLAGKGVRFCLTDAQVKGDDIPLTDPKSGCTQRNPTLKSFTVKVVHAESLHAHDAVAQSSWSAVGNTPVKSAV